MRNFFLALALLPQVVFAGDIYKTYHNSRFDYSISYPQTTLYPQGESDNQDGQKFLSKNADAELIVYGSNNVLEQSLSDLYTEDSRGGTSDSPQKVVTYRTLKGNWFVVSGHDLGKIFYQKTIFNKGQFKTFIFKYDEKSRKNYDSITAKISKSFKG